MNDPTKAQSPLQILGFMAETVYAHIDWAFQKYPTLEQVDHEARKHVDAVIPRCADARLVRLAIAERWILEALIADASPSRPKHYGSQ